jgi:dihydrofolate reductase
MNMKKAIKVSRLKQQPGQDILVAGSATLVNTLVEHDLVDEYHLLVYPVILGSGKRLFKDLAQPVNLKLLEAKSFKTGVVLLSCAPERK